MVVLRSYACLTLLSTSASAFGIRMPTMSTRNTGGFYTSSSLQMSTEFDFDVAIVGCGVGGHGAALHSRGQSLKTAVFAGGDVGGTCVNRGCVPSKALLAASGRVRDMRDASHLADLGIHVQGEVTFSREGIAAHAKNLANRVKGNLEASLVGLGVDVIAGRGVLTGKPHEVKDEATGVVYTAKVRTVQSDEKGTIVLVLRMCNNVPTIMGYHPQSCHRIASLTPFQFHRTLSWPLVPSRLSLLG